MRRLSSIVVAAGRLRRYLIGFSLLLSQAHCTLRQPVSESADPSADRAVAFIDASGGTASLDGLIFSAFPGTLSFGTTITLHRRPAGIGGVGATYEIGPSGQVFGVPH